MILTLGCGKYRFNRHDFGTIGGTAAPLDMGQCNDAYSAIVAASAGRGFRVRRQRTAALLDRFLVRAEGGGRAADPAGAGYAQCAARPHPAGLPHAGAVNVLVEKFGIQPIGDAKADIEASLSRAA